MAGSDVDTSFYPKPVSPLDQAGTVAGLIGQLNQNKLFNQQYQTNLGLSEIYKNAIDPSTGQLDMNKVRAMIATNPEVSYGIGPALQQSQQMQSSQLGIEQSKIDLAQKRMGIYGQVISPLMALEKPTQKDVMKAAGDLISSGAFSAPEVIARFTDPNDPLPPGGPELKDWITRHYIQSQSEASRMQLLFGTPQTVNTGQQTQVISPSPLGGIRPLGALQQQLPPTTPTYNSEFGQPGYLGPQGAAGASAPPGTAGAPTGRYAGGAPSQGGFVPSGPPLGTEAARSTAATGSANLLNTLRADVQGSGGRIFTLNQALKGLQTTGTGPGSEALQNILSFLSSRTGLVPPGEVQRIKSYDEANKYLTQYAMQQSAVLGQGTDEKLATALTGNASTHINNMAAQEVVKANIGLERMKQAQAQAFDNAGLQPEEFSKFSTQWNKGVDPRAFVVDQMTPQTRATMLNDMKPSEKRRFLDTLKTAVGTGILSLSDLNAQ